MQGDLNELEPEPCNFVESIHELDGIRALLLVHSDGAVIILNEDKESGKIEMRESKSRFTNLIGGQLHHISEDQIINIRRDKQSELYKIVIDETRYDL